MANYIEVLEKKRGPTSIFQFLFSATEYHNYNNERKSKEFEIANLATVHLQMKQYSENFDIYLAYMKHEMAKNSSVNMFVTCEATKFFTKMSCPEIWSSVCLGRVNGTLYTIVNKPNIIRVSNAIGVLNITVFRDEHIISNPLLYQDQDFTDFELMAADGSVAVHKVCLAARSDVFRRMFAGEWKEKRDGGVEVKDVTKQTLQDMKDFIYLGKLPEDRLRPLIVVAKKYLIADLVEACAKNLAETVLPEDLYSLHELTGQNLPELSIAITELTSDAVVHGAYEIKMAKRNTTALKKDSK